MLNLARLPSGSSALTKPLVNQPPWLVSAPSVCLYSPTATIFSPPSPAIDPDWSVTRWRKVWKLP